MRATVEAKRYHRFRFYPKVWSTFDGIEECKRPKGCVGCTYKHPFCDETGKLIPEPQEDPT